MLEIKVNENQDEVNLDVKGTFQEIWCDFALALDTLVSTIEEHAGPKGRDMFLEITKEYIEECIDNPEMISEGIEASYERDDSVIIDMEAMGLFKKLAEQSKEDED